MYSKTTRLVLTKIQIILRDQESFGICLKTYQVLQADCLS